VNLYTPRNKTASMNAFRKFEQNMARLGIRKRR
jgi:hypothetical protein